MDHFFANMLYHFDFILSHTVGDKCPYLRLKIFDQPVKGMLDLGASCTIGG